jgi:hypothetical protein
LPAADEDGEEEGSEGGSKGEEDQDLDQEEGKGSGNTSSSGAKMATAVKRGRPSKAAKIAAKKGKGFVKFMQQDDEMTEDKEQEEGQDSGNTSASGTKMSTAVKRGRPSKAAKIAASQGNSSVKHLQTVQQDSDSNTQIPTPRKRGRPSKNESAREDGAKELASSSTSTRAQGKRKRGDSQGGPRKSSRAAAEAATQQIAELSVSFPNSMKACSQLISDPR